MVALVEAQPINFPPLASAPLLVATQIASLQCLSGILALLCQPLLESVSCTGQQLLYNKSGTCIYPYPLYALCSIIVWLRRYRSYSLRFAMSSKMPKTLSCLISFFSSKGRSSSQSSLTDVHLETVLELTTTEARPGSGTTNAYSFELITRTTLSTR